MGIIECDVVGIVPNGICLGGGILTCPHVVSDATCIKFIDVRCATLVKCFKDCSSLW